jgi:hypothetical protein
MPASGHQISRLDAKLSHRYDPSDTRPSNNGLREAGKEAVAEEEVRFEYSRHADVMFVDYRETPEGVTVDTVEIGDMVGFPGQVQARVNHAEKILYGITIQNYSGFRRRLVWHYKTAAVRDTILLLLKSILAGSLIDSHSRTPQHCV